MIKTKKYIERLQRNFVRINKRQEEEILKYWGKYINDNIFTPQDVWEQTRKVMQKVDKYN